MSRGYHDDEGGLDDEDEVRIADVKATRETDKALLVIIDGESQWIPKSQITADSDVWKKGDEGTLVITGWFATKEGLS